jgi:hypothetical protein
MGDKRFCSECEKSAGHLKHRAYCSKQPRWTEEEEKLAEEQGDLRELWHFSFAIVQKKQLWTPWTTIKSQMPTMGRIPEAREAAMDEASDKTEHDANVLGTVILYENVLGGGYRRKDLYQFECPKHGGWQIITRPGSAISDGAHRWPFSCLCLMSEEEIRKMNRRRAPGSGGGF